MKTKSNKIISLLLAVVMVIAAFPAIAFAKYTPEWYYPSGTSFASYIGLCYYKDGNEGRNAI